VPAPNRRPTRTTRKQFSVYSTPPSIHSRQQHPPPLTPGIWFLPGPRLCVRKNRRTSEMACSYLRQSPCHLGPRGDSYSFLENRGLYEKRAQPALLVCDQLAQLCAEWPRAARPYPLRAVSAIRGSPSPPLQDSNQRKRQSLPALWMDRLKESYYATGCKSRAALKRTHSICIKCIRA